MSVHIILPGSQPLQGDYVIAGPRAIDPIASALSTAFVRAEELPGEFAALLAKLDHLAVRTN